MNFNNLLFFGLGLLSYKIISTVYKVYKIFKAKPPFLNKKVLVTLKNGNKDQGKIIMCGNRVVVESQTQANNQDELELSVIHSYYNPNEIEKIETMDAVPTVFLNPDSIIDKYIELKGGI